MERSLPDFQIGFGLTDGGGIFDLIEKAVIAEDDFVEIVDVFDGSAKGLEALRRRLGAEVFTGAEFDGFDLVSGDGGGGAVGRDGPAVVDMLEIALEGGAVLEVDSVSQERRHQHYT